MTLKPHSRKLRSRPYRSLRSLTAFLNLKIVDWQKPIKKESKCKDCDGNGWTGPMLRNDIWDSITTTRRILLCFECIEKRLGRPLTIDDLNTAAINYATRILIKRLEEKFQCQEMSNSNCQT